MLSNFQKHARRVYEILRLRNTDMSDEEKARDFRLEVKKRLYGPYRVSVCLSAHVSCRSMFVCID